MKLYVGGAREVRIPILSLTALIDVDVENNRCGGNDRR